MKDSFKIESVDTEIPMVGSSKDFMNDVRCRTENLLREQMSTYGITVDRLHRQEVSGPNAFEQFIDLKTLFVILEVRIIPEELKAVVTQKYEEYEGEI